MLYNRFDDELWNLLSDDAKVRVAQDIRQNAHKNIQFVESTRAEYEQCKHQLNPVSRFLWRMRLSLIAAFHVPPEYKKGYKSKSLYARWWLQRLTVKSRVVKFFNIAGDHVIDDPDSAMSAMALICALVVTIPFGVFALVNDDFLTRLKATVESCPDGMAYGGKTYKNIYFGFVGSPCLTLYSAIMGLIIASIYFIFKPTKGKDIERWSRKQGRFMMMIGFSVSVIAVIGLLLCGFYIYSFYSVEMALICTQEGSADWIYIPGVSACYLILALSVFAMW